MTVLLFVIYITFISLGLPDSLLGSAWPIMHSILNVPQEYAGILSFATCICTVISSLSAMWLNKHLGTGKTIAISTLMTSFALFGYSFSSSFVLLIPLSLVLGLGAGAIDSALNNYVALKYKSSHMSFLHAFWGLGATVGPLILSIGLSSNNYQLGYRIIASIQLSLAVVQFLFVKRFNSEENQKTINKDGKEVRNIIEGTSRDWTKYLAMLAFFLYCSIETSMFVWVSTYSVNYLNFSIAEGARIASMFFVGITGGRLISGFISNKIKTVPLIYISAMISTVFALVMILNFNKYISALSILFIGIGFAPLYPSMIHRTPRRFGSIISPKVIGQQMASAYIGSAFMPPLVGVIMLRFGYLFLPYLILIFSVLIIIVTKIIELPKAQ
ncbi:MAG: MFS transporter [Pleomorphochaeta sp.]